MRVRCPVLPAGEARGVTKASICECVIERNRMRQWWHDLLFQDNLKLWCVHERTGQYIELADGRTGLKIKHKRGNINNHLRRSSYR